MLRTAQPNSRLGAAVLTVDSDDATGAIAKFTLQNGSAKPATFTYRRNGVAVVKTAQAGQTITYAPPTSGVKWQSDDISWSLA